MNNNKIKGLCLSTLVLTAAISNLAKANETWNMPAAYSAKNYITSSYISFAETVTKHTNGELEIIVHPSGSLYAGSEILRAVRTGQVEIGGRYLGAHANEDSVFGLDTLPFIASTIPQAKELYRLSKPALEKALEERGMKLLFTAPWPAQGLFHKNEVNSIEDMEGVKFRAYDKNTSQLAKLMKAIPTKTEASEISQAFSTGVAESMIGSGAIGVFQKLWDYVDYFYTVNAWIPKSGVIVNLDAWNSLSKENQMIVQEVASQTEINIWSQVESVTLSYNTILAENGMNVVAPSESLKASLSDFGRQISIEWSEDASEESKQVLEDYLN